MATANAPFVKELASSDRKTRDKALESLTLFLRARRDLSLLELLKIWKGLFFCFYHSDRPLTQQALARALSYSLVPSLPTESRLRFLRAFWITIGREFHALDRLRLDKYLFLIRCYVGVGFEGFLKKENIKKKSRNDKSGVGEEDDEEEGKRKRKRGGTQDSKKRRKAEEDQSDKQQQQQQQQQDPQKDGEEDDDDEEKKKWSDLESYISILEEGPLCPINFDPSDNTNRKRSSSARKDDETIQMPHGPDGLRYHIIDIWLDELAKVIDENDEKEGAKTSNNGTSTEEKLLLKDRCNIPMDLLLRPFEKLKAESPTKTVRLRASEVLDDERLVEWGFRTKPVSDDEDDEEEEEEEEDGWGGFD